MARIVNRTHTGPLRVVIDGKDNYLCHCGLSNNLPFSNGSHKLTQGQDPAKLYWYDDAGTRRECVDSFPDIRTL